MSLIYSFPYSALLKYYGFNIFWAEEYWAYSNYLGLLADYPRLTFEGLVNNSVADFFAVLGQDPVYCRLKDTRSYSDITEGQVSFLDSKINVGTSHAPSRIKALRFLEEFGDDLVIISIDAHFDLQGESLLHNKWVTDELAPYVVLIGGWAESKYDFERDRDCFASYFSSVQCLRDRGILLDCVRGKKVYITLDLDYYQLSSKDYLGYSNYWHRNYLIGHSNTFRQLLDERLGFISPSSGCSSISCGKILGFFNDLSEFEARKAYAIAQQTRDIIRSLTILASFLSRHSARLVCFDIVEYSLLCDWNYATLRELVQAYPHFLEVLCPVF